MTARAVFNDMYGSWMPDRQEACVALAAWHTP
jgi:hypothetical protein